MPRPWSIQARLTWHVVGLVLLAWGLAISVTLMLFSYEINEMLDEELESLAQSTVLYLDGATGGPVPRSIGINPGDGERLLRILRPQDPAPDRPWPALRQDGFHSLSGWRVLRLSAEGAVIEVAHNLTWRREELLEASSVLLVFVVPLVALLLWALRRSLKNGFRPLSRLSRQISSRSPADLSAFAAGGLPVELMPLAEGVNGYIGRIEALRQSERKFVANASHELRTPLAAIRAQLELSRAPDAHAALPLLDNLTRRVERLLQLSRAEAGLGLGRGPTDLLQILRLLLRETAARSQVPVLFDDGDQERLMVAADADALAIVIRNLLENALEHGTGTVELRLGSDWLRIRNPASSGFQDDAFARAPSSKGLGLGLSIVNDLAEAMGMRIEKTYADGRAEVLLRLPLG